MSDFSCWYFINRDLARWRVFLVNEYGFHPELLEGDAAKYVELVQVLMEKSNGRGSYVPAEVAKEWLINKEYRLACFSDMNRYDAKSDILMWSHYADSCRGVRVEIEIDEQSLPSGLMLQSVRYDDARPVLDLTKTSTWDKDDKEYSRYVMECLWSKCPAWGYEHEVRLVVDLAKANDAVGFAHDNEAKYDYVYWNLPVRSIKSVSFGFAANERRTRELIGMCRRSRFRFWQMQLSLDDYNPVYRPC